ncbi:hypothetical protein BH24ACT22_BH24ACT22_21240 [soil metagenome]
MEKDPNYGRPREPGDDTDAVDGADDTRDTVPPPEYEMNPKAEETRDLGYAEDTVSVASEHPPGELSTQDERTWSILSHVSVLAWPLTGFLPIAPLVVWLLYKDRSPRIGFHALQSLWYQVAWLALGTIGGFLATIFTLLTFGIGGLVVAPLAAILGLVPFAHQLYAAYKVSQGVDYRYPFIADKLDGGEQKTL